MADQLGSSNGYTSIYKTTRFQTKDEILSSDCIGIFEKRKSLL